jgi:hypothetical protein
MTITKKGMTRAGVGAIVALLLVILVGCSSSTKPTAQPKPVPTVTVTATPSPAPVDRQVIVDIVQQTLAQAGFDPSDHTVDQVDPTKDNSTAAAGAFSSDKKLQTAQDVVQFLSSGTPEAEAVIAEAIKQTGATRAELLATANWIPVQFTGVSVQWGGNTYYTDAGVNTESGVGRVDKVGTVAVIFVPPQQVAAGKVTSIFVLRGACGNPQTQMPHPYIPPAPCTEPWYAGHAGYRNIGPCQWMKIPQSDAVLRDGGTAGAKQSVQDQSTSGTYVGPTVNNGTPVPEPTANPVVPANPSTPVDPVAGGYNGGSTTQPGQTAAPDPGPTQPPVSGDPGGF